MRATEAIADIAARQESRRRSLSVCHIASGDRWAGAEAQIAMLLESLVRGKQVTVSAIFLNEGRLAAEARSCGVEVLVIPESEYGFFQILARARDFLREGGVDGLHSHRYKENLLAFLLGRRCHLRFVVRSQHGLSEPFEGIRYWKQACLQSMDRLIGRYGADRVVGVSREMCESLERRLGNDKVTMIHNGIVSERVRSDFSPAMAKHRLQLSPDCYVIGTAGRLDPIKRLDIFIAAAHLILEVLPAAKFLIVGEGSEKQQLSKLVTDSGLQESVLFLGHRDDIYDVLRAMDILVLSSDHEGLPMVLLEALNLGVPVVARNVGGIPEVLEDDGGILVNSDRPNDLANACLRVLNDHDLRAQLALGGTQRVAQNFGAERNAEKMAEMYLSLGGNA